MTLWYLPLEPYRERYTAQLSAPQTGWLERHWLASGIPYRRVDPAGPAAPRTIASGSVVDAVGRSLYAFGQVAELLRWAEAGEVTSDDVIYLDDFWTPGVEALPYAFRLLGLRPRLYAYLWAQSVDEYDFTHPMRRWLRHYERGLGEVLAGVFVACPSLKALVVAGGIAPADKVHVVGLPFDPAEVLCRMPVQWQDALAKPGGEAPHPRRDQVVFSSRWDREKNPGFFLRVAAEVIAARPTTRFVVCTSAPQLRSNEPRLLSLLAHYRDLYPNNLFLREGLSKEEYYCELAWSKVQLNTADQDWVSYTLLEASVAGCYPVYPNFRSFPETLRHVSEHMYAPRDVAAGAARVLEVLARDDLWTMEAVRSRAWIHERFADSWARMTNRMGLTQLPTATPFLEEG